LSKSEYKKLDQRRFVSLVCEQYYNAIKMPKSFIDGLRDEDQFLLEQDLNSPYNIAILPNTRLTWDKIQHLTAKQILQNYIAEAAAADVVVVDDGSGAYRGIAIALAIPVGSETIVGRAVIDKYRKTTLMMARPYDLFATLVETGYIPEWEKANDDKAEVYDN